MTSGDKGSSSCASSSASWDTRQRDVFAKATQLAAEQLGEIRRALRRLTPSLNKALHSHGNTNTPASTASKQAAPAPALSGPATGIPADATLESNDSWRPLPSPPPPPPTPPSSPISVHTDYSSLDAHRRRTSWDNEGSADEDDEELVGARASEYAADEASDGGHGGDGAGDVGQQQLELQVLLAKASAIGSSLDTALPPHVARLPDGLAHRPSDPPPSSPKSPSD